MPADAATPVPMSWASDHHLRLELGNDASAATHHRVRRAYERLRRVGIPALRDLTPAYATILLTFELAELDAERAEGEVRAALAHDDDATIESPTRLVEIPTCYEGDFAPDLADVASMHALAPADVIARHAGAEYTVHFLGFSPGFAYLGGLPTDLATPRLDRPRLRVPAGSVGIAGAQTGIYPHATPGGWRLIGRTPIAMFDGTRDPPALLAMGDRVRFVPISRERFAEIEREQKSP